MINYLQLVNDIRIHVTDLFDQYHANDLMYHNLEHTKTVVERSSEIAAYYHLGGTEIFIISAAAWFHDTGQLVGGNKSHEDRSVIKMKKFLEPMGIQNEIMDKIEGCICATKLPQNPKSLLEEIICDADTYNLGTEAFLKTDKLLKKEFELRKMSVENWEENTLELLLNHKYFTQYCQKLLSRDREKNIELVRHVLTSKK